MAMPDGGTTPFWQRLDSAEAVAGALEPPYRDRFPARLADGRYLLLPLRRLPDEPGRAVASFIANHASFAVIEALADHMAALARPLEPEVIVGLPTLGLTFAPPVAARLGFGHYAPLGTSRKYWYDEALSVPTRSITTRGAGRRLYLDPHLVARVRGRRLLLVDDAISSAGTAAAALELLGKLDAQVVGMVVAMVQGERWRGALEGSRPGFAARVRGAFLSPRLVAGQGGWWPE